MNRQFLLLILLVAAACTRTDNVGLQCADIDVRCTQTADCGNYPGTTCGGRRTLHALRRRRDGTRRRDPLQASDADRAMKSRQLPELSRRDLSGRWNVRLHRDVQYATGESCVHDGREENCANSPGSTCDSTGFCSCPSESCRKPPAALACTVDGDCGNYPGAVCTAQNVCMCP